MARTITSRTSSSKQSTRAYHGPKGPPQKRPGRASNKTPKNTVSEGTPKRHKPGVVALREIRKYQKSTNLLIKKTPFNRLVREIAQDFKSDIRFQPLAIEALQEATEAYIISVLEDTNEIAIHAKRVTITLKDMTLAVRIRNQ